MSIQGIQGQVQLQAAVASPAAASAPASEESREGAAERAREGASSRAVGSVGQLQAYQGSKIDLMA